MRCGTLRTASRRGADVANLDDLVAALHGGTRHRGTRATSLRLPADLHEAASIATALGMDRSLTAATTRALRARIEAFLRERAIAEHLAAFPSDEPTLATVALRRVSGTDHPGAAVPDLVARVSAWYAERHPLWARSGQVDEAVDRVLEHVEAIAAVQATDTATS